MYTCQVSFTLAQIRVAIEEAFSAPILFYALRELSQEAGYVFCHPTSSAAKRLEDERDSLTDDQYRAVVRFLERIADGPFSLDDRYRAVSALQFLWTRFGIDQRRVTVFYDPLVSYRRPRDSDPEMEKLACQIGPFVTSCQPICSATFSVS